MARGDERVDVAERRRRPGPPRGSRPRRSRGRAAGDGKYGVNQMASTPRSARYGHPARRCHAGRRCRRRPRRRTSARRSGRRRRRATTRLDRVTAGAADACGHRTGGRAHHQLQLHLLGERRQRRAAERLHDEVGDAPAGALQRLAHGGDPHQRGEVDVVVADHGDVAGDLPSEHLGGLHHPDALHVGRGDDRRRWVVEREQLDGHVLGRRAQVRPVADQRRIERDPGVSAARPCSPAGGGRWRRSRTGSAAAHR